MLKVRIVDRILLKLYSQRAISGFRMVKFRLNIIACRIGPASNNKKYFTLSEVGHRKIQPLQGISV